MDLPGIDPPRSARDAATVKIDRAFNSLALRYHKYIINIIIQVYVVNVAEFFLMNIFFYDSFRWIIHKHMTIMVTDTSVRINANEYVLCRMFRGLTTDSYRSIDRILKGARRLSSLR